MNIERKLSDSEVIEEFNRLFEITSEGLGSVEINGKKIEVNGWLEVRSSSLNVETEAPVSYNLEETVVVFVHSGSQNESEKLILSTESRNEGLTDLFKQKFPHIRDSAHMTALLFEFCRTLPAFKESTSSALYEATMKNHFLPLERKRLETINTDPTKLHLNELKLRQELYEYAKKLARSAGKSEQEFLKDIEEGVTSQKFLGGSG